MPLPGFNALKEKIVEQKLIPNDDSGLGNGPITYTVRADQSQVTFDAHVEYEGQVELGDMDTVLEIQSIKVLVMKKHLNYVRPAINDRIEFEGQTYSVQPVILEEGESWWRILCMNENLTHKGISKPGGR
jgi:hypothetical protein